MLTEIVKQWRLWRIDRLLRAAEYWEAWAQVGHMRLAGGYSHERSIYGAKMSKNLRRRAAEHQAKLAV